MTQYLNVGFWSSVTEEWLHFLTVRNSAFSKCFGLVPADGTFQEMSKTFHPEISLSLRGNM